MTGCTAPKTDNNETGNTMLNPQKIVSMVSVSSLPEGYQYSFSTEDAIETITSYINSLELTSDYSENPDEYAGMTWVVEILFDDGSKQSIYHFGNMFIKDENGPWFKMQYKQASRFDSVLEEAAALQSTGVSDKTEPHLIETKTAYANWSEDETIYKDCLNRDKVSSAARGHFPVYLMDTKADLESFKTTLGDILLMDQGCDETPSFNEIVKSYDDSFFSERALIIVYVTSSSGSFRFDVRDVTVEDAVFCLNVIQTNHPEVYTCDMAGWYIVVEVMDSDISDIKDYDAVLVQS